MYTVCILSRSHYYCTHILLAEPGSECCCIIISFQLKIMEAEGQFPLIPQPASRYLHLRMQSQPFHMRRRR